jgi:hypothetical protein
MDDHNSLLYCHVALADMATCARMLAYIDEMVTACDFTSHIYPEPCYTEANRWDRSGVPYNTFYALYAHLGKHDVARSLSPADGTRRFVAWYRNKCRDSELERLVTSKSGWHIISVCWRFLGRLSIDLGLIGCLKVHTDDKAKATAMMARFEETLRRGSLFWLGATDEERRGLLKWQDDIDRQYRQRMLVSEAHDRRFVAYRLLDTLLLDLANESGSDNESD